MQVVYKLLNQDLIFQHIKRNTSFILVHPLFSPFHYSQTIKMTDSYDQYADQLLNSAFQNARKTPAINTSTEDQLLNQLFPNARYSAPLTPSPMFGNNPTSNEWFLLQQLQQQKMLLERQQQMMSPSVFHQVPIQSSTPVVQEEAPVKKIARVPVNSDPVILEDSNVEPTLQQQPQQQLNSTAVSQQPPLNKKKSFLRSLSLKRPSNKDLATAAVAVATTAIAAKSLKEQYNERKREEQEMIRAEKERKRLAKEKKMASKNAAKLAAASTISDYEEEPEMEYQSTSQPKYVERRPSFWKPREERPKGWWKGQRATQKEEEQYEEVEYEEVEEEEEEEEVVPVVVAPPVKTKKVVRKVVVPKPVPSIKASKPKRPMAFKQPTPRKSKPEKKKKAGKNAKSNTKDTSSTTAAVAQPMYMMPQQMYQPAYYQQPMMMPQQFMPGSYYPQMMGQVPQQQSTQPERRSSPARKKSIYNPRDNSNDKCSIM